jgi:glyoxylase-like metal-dependent hydrolase (beta-lactamase superfamily II)
MGGAETMYPDYRLKLKTAGGAQQNQNRSQQNQNVDNGEVHVLPVRGNVYMLVAAGANITVEVHRAGVLLVDTGVAQMSDKVLAAIRQLAMNPVTTIINTHVHGDHTGGNEKIAAAGVTFTGGNVAGDIQDAAEGAAVIAHENVLNRMSAPTGRQAATPARAWPTDTYFGGVKTLTPYYYGDAIQIVHQPAAHTDGDSVIFFRRSDVVVTGEILDLTSYPMIDGARGGRFSGVIAALNRIIDLTVAKDWQEGGTMVIPGRGRVVDESDVVEYRDMLTIIRDRIQDMVKRGMTLEQVKTARPTFEYDGRYGMTAGPWTTTMFVEAAYRDLMTSR